MNVRELIEYLSNLDPDIELLREVPYCATNSCGIYLTSIYEPEQESYKELVKRYGRHHFNTNDKGKNFVIINRDF